MEWEKLRATSEAKVIVPKRCIQQFEHNKDTLVELGGKVDKAETKSKRLGKHVCFLKNEVSKRRNQWLEKRFSLSESTKTPKNNKRSNLCKQRKERIDLRIRAWATNVAKWRTMVASSLNVAVDSICLLLSLEKIKVPRPFSSYMTA